MFLKQNEKKAFTLMEILLSIGLMSLLIGISVPVLQSFYFSDEVDTAVSLGARALRTAQLNSQDEYKDSAWGVRFANGGMTVFKGATYATRTATEDVIYSIDTTVSVSGLSEVDFAKFTGTTATTGTVTFTRNSSSRNITINAKGTLTY